MQVLDLGYLRHAPTEAAKFSCKPEDVAALQLLGRTLQRVFLRLQGVTELRLTGEDMTQFAQQFSKMEAGARLDWWKSLRWISALHHNCIC